MQYFSLGIDSNQHIGLGCQFPSSPGGCQGNRVLWRQNQEIHWLPYHWYVHVSEYYDGKTRRYIDFPITGMYMCQSTMTAKPGDTLTSLSLVCTCVRVLWRQNQEIHWLPYHWYVHVSEYYDGKTRRYIDFPITGMYMCQSTMTAKPGDTLTSLSLVCTCVLVSTYA